MAEALEDVVGSTATSGIAEKPRNKRVGRTSKMRAANAQNIILAPIYDMVHAAPVANRINLPCSLLNRPVVGKASVR